VARRAGWEKGQVERQVKSVREWLFTSRPWFKGFEDSTPGLPISAERSAGSGLISRKKNGSSGVVFDEEQASLAKVNRARKRAAKRKPK